MDRTALPSTSTRRLLDEPLRVCIDTMLDPFGAYEAIRDAHGTITDFGIVHVNHPACVSLGLSRDQLVGHRVSDLFPEIRSNGYFEIYASVVNTGAPFTQDGRERGGRFYDVRVSPLGDGFVISWRDVTARTQLELEVRRSNEALRARAEELAVLMDTIPAIVWIATDPECREIHGSRLARELLRMAPSDNLTVTPGPAAPPPPKHFTVRQNGVDLPPDQWPMQRAARGEELRNVEEELIFADGEQVWLYGSATPLRAPDGTPRGAIGAFVDITEYKRIERELRVASDAKDHFLATVSHELRTPLAAVIGYTHMLQQGVVPPDRRDQVLGTIARNARLQLGLIDDILDVASIIRGKVTLDARPLAVDAVLVAAVNTVLPMAADKGVALQLRLAASDALVHGDERRLSQVLVNVLSNAVKFTPAAGAITVSLDAGASEYIIAVADTGIGIAPEFVPHIFERFSQENAGRQVRAGLGLGLNIAQHLIAAHGGTIAAHSDGPGRGATFTLHLPAL